MNEFALILAAHGSRVDSSSNAAIWQMAERVRDQAEFAEVTCAFHHGAPGFADVLGAVKSKRVVVVPIMTSEGYYSREALPRALRSHPDFAMRRVTIAPPIGVHPEISRLMRARLNKMIHQFGLVPESTSVAVIGHGTPRNESSRISTNELAAALQKMGPCSDVFPAFLDEEPFVETVPGRAAHNTIVVLLFLIAAGPHALRDVPRRLELSMITPPPLTRGDTGGSSLPPFAMGDSTCETSPSPLLAKEGDRLPTPPFCGRVNGKTFIIDEAFGTDAAIIPLIVDLARRAAKELFNVAQSSLQSSLTPAHR